MAEQQQTLTTQQVQDLLAAPTVSAKVKQHFKITSETLKKLLEELEEENPNFISGGIHNPLSKTNSEFYKAFMVLLQAVYLENQQVMENLKSFYKKQQRLEERFADKLKAKSVLAGAVEFVEQPKQAVKPEESSTVWERLQKLQQEIIDLAKIREEAEQEIEELEKTRQQSDAVQRLADDTKPQTHTQQIRDFALIQDTNSRGVNLLPSAVKKFFTDKQFRQEVVDRFSKSQAELDQIAVKIDAKLQTKESTSQLINEKCQEYNNVYKMVPKPTSAKKVAKEDESEEKVYGTQTWQKAGEEQAKAERMERNMETATQAFAPQPSMG